MVQNGKVRAARMRYMQSVRDAEPGHMCEAGGSELGSRHAPCAAEAAGGRTLVRHPGHRVQREAHVHLRRRQVEALPQHEHLGRCAQCSEGLPLPQQLCAHTSRCKSQPSVRPLPEHPPHHSQRMANGSPFLSSCARTPVGASVSPQSDPCLSTLPTTARYLAVRSIDALL